MLPIYESTRSCLELFAKAGGRVVYFAQVVRFTPPSPDLTKFRFFLEKMGTKDIQFEF